MRVSELIARAAEAAARESSPWRPELVAQLQHLVSVARMHEQWIAQRKEDNDAHIPRRD